MFLSVVKACCIAQADFKVTVLMPQLLLVCNSRCHVFLTASPKYALKIDNVKLLLCSLCLQLLYFILLHILMFAFSLSVKNFRDVFDKPYIGCIDCFNVDILRILTFLVFLFLHVLFS